MREVLGGGSGGRYYADGEDTIHVVPDSRNLPTEFNREPFPLHRREARSGHGFRRSRTLPAVGLGYEKHIRMLKDAHFMSIAGSFDPRLLGSQGRQGRSAVTPWSWIRVDRTSVSSTR